jgi:type VI secretion system protein ImpE
MDTRELYRAGKLTEAVARQNEEVRSHPTDVEKRSFLSELLCLVGNLERADTQLEAIERMQPGCGPGLGLMRQLIRAEKTRIEVQHEGRAPEFPSPPSQHAELLVRAGVALRAGDDQEAARLTAEAEEVRPRAAGTCDGEAMDDFRDLDDFTAGTFEVLTSTGRYLWIPMEQVLSLQFDPPSRPLDLLWRPAMMDLRDGPEGKVFVPATYSHFGQDVDDAARLGRRTDWIPCGEGGAVRGNGLRTFLTGDDARSVLEITRLEYQQ